MSDTPRTDGGPAFPVAGFQFKNKDGSEGFVLPMEGMTIRDYFAAAIMHGLMSSQCQVDDPYPIYAYRIADAMLKAREAKP
jgi:hypothetical protein